MIAFHQLWVSVELKFKNSSIIVSLSPVNLSYIVLYHNKLQKALKGLQTYLVIRLTDLSVSSERNQNLPNTCEIYLFTWNSYNQDR